MVDPLVYFGIAEVILMTIGTVTLISAADSAAKLSNSLSNISQILMAEEYAKQQNRRVDLANKQLNGDKQNL